MVGGGLVAVFSFAVEFLVVDGGRWCTCACIWWVLRTMEFFFSFFSS